MGFRPYQFLTVLVLVAMCFLGIPFAVKTGHPTAVWFYCDTLGLCSK